MKDYNITTRKFLWGLIKSEARTAVTKKEKTVITQLVQEFKDITRVNIDKWRQALSAIENAETPRWFLLQDLYDNLEADGHYKSLRALRKAAVLSKNFMIREADGNENPEKTKMLRKKWFFDLMRHFLDNIYKGYTVLELVDPVTMKWKIVPRRNVDPDKTRIYFEVGGEQFVDYSLPAFSSRIVSITNIEKFGILNDIVPQLIWKRNAQQTWADFSEKFGIPLISAETMETDTKKLNLIEEMLSQLGQAAQAVLPEGTKITIHDSATKGDPYKVFQEQIKTTNAEMSKRVVGGTMLSDDGSSLSQSEVHERNLEKIAFEDAADLEFAITELLPILNNFGFNFAEGDEFIFDNSEELSLLDLWKVVNEGNMWYDIPEDFVSRKFGVPINGKKQQVQPVQPAQSGGLAANFR